MKTFKTKDKFGSLEIQLVADDGRLIKTVNANGFGWETTVKREMEYLSKVEERWNRISAAMQKFDKDLSSMLDGGGVVEIFLPKKGWVRFKIRTESNVWIPQTVSRSSYGDLGDGMRGDREISGGYNLKTKYEFPVIGAITFPGRSWSTHSSEDIDKLISLLEEA